MRCVLEARNHERNCFITLTYSDEQLPKNQSLDKSHLQKFFKRLRKAKGELRYYACGEYGDLTKRAHYHACLFGMDFEDKVEFKRSGDHVIYISEELNRLWGYGHTSIGPLNFETAAYCARYVLKKRTSKKGEVQHAVLDEETGELTAVRAPYAAMSLRPAIGREWMDKYHGDIYNIEKDFLFLRGKKMRPPKYFDRIYDNINSERMEKIKEKRVEEREELSLDELRAHEENARARLKASKRLSGEV